jgi:hypothetical protein
MNQYVLYKTGKKIKLTTRDKILINRNTPPGDDPIYYLEKPYGGKQEIEFVASFNLGEYDRIDKWCDRYGRTIYSSKITNVS